MFKSILTTLLIFIVTNVFAQEQKIKLDNTQKLGSATKSEVFNLACIGEINTLLFDINDKSILANLSDAREEPKGPDYELIRQIKKNKLLLKRQQLNLQNKVVNSELSIQTVIPIVGASWLGNENNGYSPLDNNIAISDGGIIVSVANTTIRIENISNTLLYYNSIPNFFNDPGITNTCDPVVLYDKISDRFILFFQECAGNSANSYLCICFSKTNNPSTGGWWKYKLTGNPLNNNCWFDYPKMAVSNNELYITGNLYTNSSNYNQSVLYQIQKSQGYVGGSINWQFWSNITGSPFTLVPVGNGQGLSYGPGCFLVATTSSGASNIKLYDLTDDMSAANEQLNYYSVSTITYSPAANAIQLGSTCLLDNGDCRALSGFYLNGIIHLVFHSDYGGGWNGINYNRLNVSNLTNQSSMFGLSGYDYSYPSVASYSTSPTDNSVMVGFGRVSSSIYPEVRVVNCDNSMNWSGSTLVKGGENYVSYISTTEERWGDYTGIARKHNSSNASVWLNGMFGRLDNKWDTWIAEIHATTTYTFIGTGNWNIASNWINNIIPPAILNSGSEIIINPIITGECILNVQQTINQGASFKVITGKKFRVLDNLIIQ